MKDHLTITQAAKIAGVSRQAVWNWIKSGDLAAFIVGDKQFWLIVPADLDAYLKERTRLKREGRQKAVRRLAGHIARLA